MNDCKTTPFTKDFFRKHQLKLLWLANTAMGRKLLCIDQKLPKLIAILPNSVHWEVSTPKRGKQSYGFLIRKRNTYAKAIHKNFYWVWKCMHEFDMNFANLYQPKWNLGFDTFGPIYPDADPETTTVDGYVTREGVNQTFTNIRSGAGVGAADASDTWVNLKASTTSNQFQTLIRNIDLFDTSVIPDTASITDALLWFRFVIKTGGLGVTDYGVDVVSSNPASNTSLASGDYGTLGSTVFATMDYTSLTTSTTFTLNADGIANISKTGISKFGLRSTWDTTGTFGGTWASGASTYSYANGREDGTGTSPYISGTYIIPAPVTGNFLMFF